MPTYPGDIQDKLDDLQALTGAERKPSELVAIYWPSPTGTTVYASAMYTQLPWCPNLADAIETYFGEAIPLTLTLIPDSTPFIDLPRAASISDDSISLTFSDLDDEFSDLLMDYGEGIRTEVFCYWPAVDLLLSMWRGMLHQPKEMNRDQVKITATSGWRAPQMLVPKRPFATSCPFIFGAHLPTQEAIDQHAGCPFNRHVGGTIGNPAYIGGDCPRRVKADCVERLTEDDGVTPTERYWPGFETREDPIPNNQTKGPNLLAKAIGNESALSDPIRVIFGERYVKALYLLAFRNELNNNHPDEGFGAALFAVSEGPNLAMWEFRINGQIVGTEHFQLRLGTLGQQPTDWSPDVNSYSGTAHGYGRILGRFNEATASDYSASIRVLGNNEIRVYSDSVTYTEGYTTNRVWCLLHILAHLRWGYGQDYPRFDIQSWIDAAAWCDEFVTLTDSLGNTFSGVRSTFNAEVTARAIQQQVKDICTAGRLGLPFEFEGKDVIVPLRAEDVDDPSIPTFSDEGPNRNIVYDGAKSSLSWSVISDESMTNQWTVNFDEAANGGVDTQFIFGDQAQQLRAGRAWGDRSKRVVNKSQAGYGINSAQEAARLGNALLYLGPLDSGGILNPFSVKFTTWYSEAFNVQNYKLIKVVNAKLQSRMAAYFTARGLEPYPGADYTCFRVMKYTRKGDLRVEIEAQQYATLEEASAEDTECVNTPVAWESDWFMESSGPGEVHSFIEVSPSGCPVSDFLAARAQSTQTITADDEHFDFTTRSFGSDFQVDLYVCLSPMDNYEPIHTWFSSGECSLANGGYHHWQTEILSPTGFEYHQWGLFFTDGGWCSIQDPAHSGPFPQFQYDHTTSIKFIRRSGDIIVSVPSAAPDFDLPVGVWTVVGDRAEYTYSRPASATDDFVGHAAASGPLFEQPFVPAAAADAPLRLVAITSGAIGVAAGNQPGITAESCTGTTGPDTFSAPRDLTAEVAAETGLVHFHWSPPSRHPELVTGYTLYESDGVTVVMPTDLVYEFEVTLAPGTYTYRLNATDGSVTSGFVSVTFTVSEPPITGEDLFVIDDLTLNNVLEDFKFNQVIA